MTANQPAPADEDRPALGASPRQALATAAALAAESVDGVAALVAPGPLGRTRTPGGVIDGVAVFPQEPGARLGVDLWLRAELVDLLALGSAVREAIAAQAAREGLTGVLGEIAVHVVDIDDRKVTS